MRSLTGTIEKAREPFPELYRKYDVKKELTRLRRILRDEVKTAAAVAR
jgi:hypothetical protein